MAELTNNNVGTEATEQVESKTYSQAEVDELLLRETDRRVSSALKKQEMKNAEKVREAQKLANMDAALKYEYELQQREAAIAAKERELLVAENTNVASKILSEKGLSLDLVNFVVADDAETMNNNIKALEKAFRNSVKFEVEKRLGSNAPKQAEAPKEYNKQWYDSLSIREKQNLKDSNPTLWKELHPNI